MKGRLLLAVLMIGAGKLMAQTKMLFPKQPLLDKQFNVRVDTSLTVPLLKDLAKTPQNNALKSLYDLKTLAQPTLANALIVTSDIDRMPIAVLSGNSKMPVVKLQGNSKMPVYGKDFSKIPPVTLARP